MGGLLILTSALVPTLLWADLTNPYIWIAVLATVGVRRRRLPGRLPEDHPPSHHGLLPRYKMGGLVLVGARRRASRCCCSRGESAALQHAAHLPVLQGPDPGSGRRSTSSFAVIVIIGATNAVNLTDGLDGLAISTFAVAAATYHGARLRHRPRRARRLSRSGSIRAGRRADDLLRRAGRREPRVPLVQLVSRRDLHGRRRLARRSAARSAPWPS